MYNALLFLRQATCSPFPLAPTKPAEVRRNDTSSFLLTMKCASGNVQLEVLRGITKIFFRKEHLIGLPLSPRYLQTRSESLRTNCECRSQSTEDNRRGGRKKKKAVASKNWEPQTYALPTPFPASHKDGSTILKRATKK